ncbi:MAG: hypothetical protein P8Z31_06930 [Gammaproteobacteria bacterium]|jgi:hypothetical protein
MQPGDPLPAEAAQLLKIYLSGGAIPGNVNPLVLIEMAKQNGEYKGLLEEARAIRILRGRIREHAVAQGLAESAGVEQVKAYMLSAGSPQEMEQLFWLLESLAAPSD